uniref:Putative secreted protein n=1 Tax=Ixodes ricinus TaxID=34613 RepID=A0A6B0TXS4_IXORI
MLTTAPHPLMQRQLNIGLFIRITPAATLWLSLEHWNRNVNSGSKMANNNSLETAPQEHRKAERLVMARVT